MRFAEISEQLIISERKINNISTINKKIESQLQAWKARTIVTDNVITFKTINIYLGTGYIDTNIVLLRVYKEGKIIIDKVGSSLRISWVVKLNTLYFISLCFSTILFIIIFLFREIKLIFALSISLALFLMLAFLGIQLIKYRLNDMIYASVYPNYNKF